mgnify:CR=1 FL=1
MANRYWVGGTGTWDTSSTTNWSTSSNGSSGASAPTSADDVFIDTSSGTGTITCTGAVCNNLTVTASQAITLGATSSTLSVYGNLSLPSGGSFAVATASGWNITFAATTTGKTITTNGKTLTNIIFNGVGGEWTLQDAITSNTTNKTLTLTNGSFNANGFSVTFGLFSSSNSNTRTLTLGNGLWTLTGTATIWTTSTTTGLTFNKGTSDILLSDTSVSSRTFTAGGLTFNKLTIGGTTGTSTLVLSTAATFSELASTKTVAHTIQISAGITITATTWSVTGTSGNVVTLQSASFPTTQATVAITNKTVNIDYLTINAIASSNIDPVTFYAGANSTNGANNTGIAFVARTTATPTVVHLLTGPTASNGTWTVQINYKALGNIN